MNSEHVKRISIKEFREQGYLQEANRQFFHPLGLALEVAIDEETGKESLGGVWDYRDDKEGITFHPATVVEKKFKENIERIKKSRAKRQNLERKNMDL